MRYRKQLSGDYSFGHGSLDFYADVPDAPAQAAGSRLRLFRGEWFLDSTEGTDWAGGVLGAGTAQTRDAVIRERILNTQGVTGISEYESSFAGETRRLTIQAQVDTVYGGTQIAGAF